jgi:hypothetical protein
MKPLRSLFLFVIFVLLSGCGMEAVATPTVPPAASITSTITPVVLPTVSSTPIPTETMLPTQVPTSKPLEDFPTSLKDVERVASIASHEEQSAEYQSMKYVLNDGIGTSILYDSVLGITPYRGILEYIGDNQLIFTPAVIPILSIHAEKGRQYELWKSGRWYLVDGFLSFPDHNTIELLTNIDKNQGSVVGIADLLSLTPFYTNTNQVEFYCRYIVHIGVYRDAELYSVKLYFDEKFKLTHMAFRNGKRLDQETINIWLPRIQAEILPDFAETYLEK